MTPARCSCLIRAVHETGANSGSIANCYSLGIPNQKFIEANVNLPVV
jgi:hypothetical protein